MTCSISRFDPLEIKINGNMAHLSRVGCFEKDVMSLIASLTEVPCQGTKKDTAVFYVPVAVGLERFTVHWVAMVITFNVHCFPFGNVSTNCGTDCA